MSYCLTRVGGKNKKTSHIILTSRVLVIGWANHMILITCLPFLWPNCYCLNVFFACCPEDYLWEKNLYSTKAPHVGTIISCIIGTLSSKNGVLMGSLGPQSGWFVHCDKCVFNSKHWLSRCFNTTKEQLCISLDCDHTNSLCCNKESLKCVIFHRAVSNCSLVQSNVKPYCDNALWDKWLTCSPTVTLILLRVTRGYLRMHFTECGWECVCVFSICAHPGGLKTVAATAVLWLTFCCCLACHWGFM